MTNQTIQAVLFGATGLAGSSVLDECIKHPKVTEITVVARKSTGFFGLFSNRRSFEGAQYLLLLFGRIADQGQRRKTIS